MHLECAVPKITEGEHQDNVDYVWGKNDEQLNVDVNGKGNVHVNKSW